MPRYDDWDNQTSAEAKSKLNGAFSGDTGVGHDHSGVGQGAPILNAANVTTNINGQALTDIFESNGVTAKNATIAGSCTGNAATATTMDGVRIRAYVSADYAHLAGQIVHFNAETFDPKNKFDKSNYICTPGVGTYLVIAKIESSGQSTLNIKKNSTVVSLGIDGHDQTTSLIYDLINLDNPTDTISIATGNGILGPTIYGGTTKSYLEIIQIA
jgi:hypothetical protein